MQASRGGPPWPIALRREEKPGNGSRRDYGLVLFMLVVLLDSHLAAQDLGLI